MTYEIPPEGDEYNARRQEDLHAAIANKAALARKHAEMMRDGAPAGDVAQVIDAIAVIEREIPHISKDLAVSVQGRNLTIFLDRMKEELQSHEANNTLLLAGVDNSLQLLNTTVAEVLNTAKQALTVAKAGAARLGKLEKDVRSLNTRHGKQIAEIAQRMDASEQDRADLRARLERIEATLGARSDGQP